MDTGTIEVQMSNTLGTTAEDTVDVPSDARRSGVSFDSVAVHYSVSASQTLSSAIDVELYVSPDQTADNTKDSSTDQTIASVHLDSSSQSVTGATDSPLLRDILESGQPKFVFGGSVSGTDLSTKVTIDLYATIEGSYSQF